MIDADAVIFCAQFACLLLLGAGTFVCPGVMTMALVEKGERYRAAALVWLAGWLVSFLGATSAALGLGFSLGQMSPGVS